MTLRFLGDCDEGARARVSQLLAGLPALPAIVGGYLPCVPAAHSPEGVPPSASGVTKRAS